MNVKRKQAAVTKYSPLVEQGTSFEEIGNLLAQDEKGYTVAEINEIRQSLFVSVPAGPEAKTKTEKIGHYEEWRCEIKLIVEDGKTADRIPEKVKLVRKCVKISDEEAETLNYGALHTPRQDYVLMYFKPE